MDYIRDVDKIRKTPMASNEGFFYELFNTNVKEAIHAGFIFRISELLPGKAHPAVEEIHDNSEHAFYILEGDGEISIDGKTYALRPGSVAYVPAGLSHQMKNTGDRLMRWIAVLAPLAATGK